MNLVSQVWVCPILSQLAVDLATEVVVFLRHSPYYYIFEISPTFIGLLKMGIEIMCKYMRYRILL